MFGLSGCRHLDMALMLTSLPASAANATSISNRTLHVAPLLGQSEQANIAGLSGRLDLALML
eukprot:16320916-Heterocapsa_arctica.AAC.1